MFHSAAKHSYPLICVNNATLLLNYVTVAAVNESIFVIVYFTYTNKFTDMKKVLFFAATAIFFASCSNNQETAEKATIDSMSQELARQHIIDSMNAAGTANGAAPVETSTTIIQSRGSAPIERTHSSSRTTHSHSSSAGSTPVGAAPTAAAPAANTATGPTAAEIEAQRKADNRKKAKSAAVGAAIGAGAGAIGGAVAGKNDHFKKEDAAIGAGVGAVLGAGAGLLLQKRKLKRERDSTQH